MKNKIKLTESELHKIIKETLLRMLNETEYGQDSTYNINRLQNKQSMIWNADDRNNKKLSDKERTERFNNRINNRKPVEGNNSTIENWKNRDAYVPRKNKRFGYNI